MGPLFPVFLPISFSDTFFYLVKKSIPRHFQDDRQCLSLPGYFVPPRSYSVEGSANLLHSISDHFRATSHLHIVAIFKKKRHKQDGKMKLHGESGYLPKTPDHQTKYVTPQFSQFFIPSYPLLFILSEVVLLTSDNSRKFNIDVAPPKTTFLLSLLILSISPPKIIKI